LLSNAISLYTSQLIVCITQSSKLGIKVGGQW
jgi:hypothetical protein